MFVLNELGVDGVPTFSALRALQAKLRRELQLEPEHHISSLSNHFYTVSPAQLYRLDFANPLVRPAMHFYPELTRSVAEVWQTKKLTKCVDLDDLSPMWADWELSPFTHFYVREVAQLGSGKYVMPMRWVTVDSRVYFDGFILHLSGNALSIADPELHQLPASELVSNLPNLRSHGFSAAFDSQFAYEWMTTDAHPLREVAKGRPAFRLRINLWSDDASGNVSKQYNSHTNVCSQNSTIPHKMLGQEYFVRFHATSQFACSSELMAGMQGDFHRDTWNSAYDCQLKQEVIFQVIPNVKTGDNPQQSEDCSHIGVRGNHNCRKDMMGGTEREKETDEGFEQFFQPGVARTSEETVVLIRAQLRQACLGVDTLVTAMQTETGVKDKISLHWIDILIKKAREQHDLLILNKSPMQDARMKGLKNEERLAMKEIIEREVQDKLWAWLLKQPPHEYATLAPKDSARSDLRAGVHYNPLLCTRGLEIHADTPTEILHSWLLGHIKYMWHLTSSSWEDAQSDRFGICLAGSSIDGLNIPPIRAQWVMKYKNSLIGKHFKMLAQIGIFQLHSLKADDWLFQLWRTAGELGALLWYPVVSTSSDSTYMHDLQILVDNILDIWATIDPSKILAKVKLHMLTHLPEDVDRHGPATLYATELYECFNGVFRLCSVYSNRQAPSRDIAVDMADTERFKHQASGGWWRDTDGRYIQAGSYARKYLVTAPELQRRLGWVDHSQAKPGFAKLLAHQKRNPSTWAELNYGDLPQDPFLALDQRVWDRCLYTVSRSHDICRPGSWVFFLATIDGEAHTMTGRIRDIRLSQGASPRHAKALVALDPADLENERDGRMKMPALQLTGALLPVPAEDILFVFNAQHDCLNGKCPIAACGQRRQEGHEVTSTELAVAHTPFNRHFLNLHALHNAHLIRECLPPHLWRPEVIYAERSVAHREQAEEMRGIGEGRRNTAKKRRVEKKAQKDAQSGAQSPGNEGLGL
ncbi:hypothetical protein GGF50DRAFT_68231 [Schizophyllum commune]